MAFRPREASEPDAEPGGVDAGGSGVGSFVDASLRRTGGARAGARDLSNAWGAPSQDGGEGGASAAHTGGTTPGATAGQHSPIQVQVERPAPSDPSPTRTTVGVGERVHFTGHGDGNWTAPSSAGLQTGAGSAFDWTAPPTAQTVTVSHARAGGNAESVQMTVVAPNAIQFRKMYDTPQVPAGAGMHTNLSFLPLNVSFYRAEWLEIPTDAVNVSGYFLTYQQQGHTLHHNPAPQWIPMEGPQNNGVDDDAWTADKPRPWSVGDFEWQIPNHYRVAGSGDAVGNLITTVTQHFHIEPDGTVTVSKGGQSATQHSSGAIDGNGGLDTIPSVAAALGLIAQDGFRDTLSKLATYRTRDPASYQNLVAALTQVAPQHYVYVGLTCSNSYAWVMSDSGTLHVSGNGGTVDNDVSIDTGQVKSFHVPFLSAFNLSTFDSNATLSVTATIEGHAMQIASSYPFHALSQDTAFPGSDGRYQIRAFIHT